MVRQPVREQSQVIRVLVATRGSVDVLTDELHDDGSAQVSVLPFDENLSELRLKTPSGIIHLLFMLGSCVMRTCMSHIDQLGCVRLIKIHKRLVVEERSRQRL